MSKEYKNISTVLLKITDIIQFIYGDICSAFVAIVVSPLFTFADYWFKVCKLVKILSTYMKNSDSSCMIAYSTRNNKCNTVLSHLV